MRSCCILGSVHVDKGRKPELLCFSSIFLKFGIGGNFEMLITKEKPKLKLENNLSKNAILYQF